MLFFPADQFDIFILREQGHLVDGNHVQFCQSFGLWEVFADEMSVEVFKVGEADELRDVGIIPDIALFVRVAVPPFFCGTPEECHIEEIGFGCIYLGDL